jgi:hypothetical protein
LHRPFLLDSIYELILLIVGNDEVDSGEICGLSWIGGSVATRQDGQQSRVLAFSLSRQFARPTSSDVGDGAGVDHMDIRVFQRAGGAISGTNELACKLLELRLVEFAAKIREEDSHGRHSTVGR